MNDDVIEPAGGTPDASPDPTTPPAPLHVPATTKRAFGRSLDDFRDQKTASGLLPAEDKLIAAVAKGEVCRLEDDVAQKWSAFQAWRNRAGNAAAAERVRDKLKSGTASADELESDADLSTLMEAVPDDVMTLILASADYAREKLGKPADWNPETAADITEFQPHQEAYFKHFGEGTVPSGIVLAARNNATFFAQCVEALKAGDDRPEELQSRIAAQPPILRPFIDELARFLPHDDAEKAALIAELDKNPEALRPAVNACLDLFERETWRWVDVDNKDLHVRAEVIRFLLLGGDDTTPVHEKGVILIGAVVTGALDCFGMTITRPLQFVGCHFTHAVDLTDATTRFLNVQACLLQPFNAARSTISGGLYMRSGCRVNGQVLLDGARIGGDFDAQGSTIKIASGTALSANGVDVAGTINLSSGFHATGEVRFFGAKIGGQLNCTQGTFLAPGGLALVADRADIGSNVRLSDGFYAAGTVQMILAKIGAQFIGSRAHIHAPGVAALVFNRATIRGDLFLESDFKATGRVSLEGAMIGGDVGANGGTFVAPDGTAVNASGVHIRGDAQLAGAFRAEGQVVLTGAKVDGSLIFTGGTFVAPNAIALTADSVAVGGSLFLNDGITVQGQVSLMGATIRGNLYGSGGTFRWPHATVLHLDNISVTGDAYLGVGFRAEGTTSLYGAKLGGVLQCTGGHFIAPKRDALILDSADIKGNVSLANGFRAEGVVRLTGARIGGELHCFGGQFIAPHASALVADGVRVTGGMSLSHGFRAEGSVRLFGARIGSQLSCSNGAFIAPGQIALAADRIEVSTNVRLDEGFRSEGDVHLILAKIGGQLACGGGTFISPLSTALIANGANVTGEVFFVDGFQSTGLVSLAGATLGGDLICRGGVFTASQGIALQVDRATIAGNVLLTGDCRIDGEAHFTGTIVKGDVQALGARINAPRGIAIHAGNIDVTGNVYLSHGFHADGEVGLFGSKIGGELFLCGGTFRNFAPNTSNDDGAELISRTALNLNKTTIDGRLWLGPASGDGDRPVNIVGSVYLGSSYASELVLDPLNLSPEMMRDGAKPSDRTVPTADVTLDGFTCDHLHIASVGTARKPEPLDAMRALLARQPSRHLGADFRPQPYEHAIALFKRMGRTEDAKALAKDKAKGERRRALAIARAKSQDALSSTLAQLTTGLAIVAWTILLWGLLAHPVRWAPLAEFIDGAGPIAWLLVIAGLATPPFRLLGRMLAVGVHWLVMDWFLGQGYDYKWPLATVLGLLFGGMALYGSAADQGAFLPVDKGFVADADHRRLCAGLPKSAEPPSKDVPLDWTKCHRKIDGLTPFHPFVYSLDLMIPFSPLGQRRDWKADADRPIRIELPGMSAWQTTGKAVVAASTLQATLAIALYALLAAFLAGRIKKD